MSTVPPYVLQALLSSVDAGQISCAQALGSEIYVGCTNGSLLRYTLQVGPDSPGEHAGTITSCFSIVIRRPESYTLSSRQNFPSGKPIDELVLIPCLSRALIFSDRQIHIYTIPSLDPLPNAKPIRNVETFAVDHQHLLRPPPSPNEPPARLLPVDFCVIKRTAIAMFSIITTPYPEQEVPFQPGAQLARRIGRYLCVADTENYNVVDLQNAQMFPLLPVNQAGGATPVKPFISVVSEAEFLILSWTGESTIGIFITGDGDPVRGTLTFPSHPLSVCLDYPNVTALLPDGSIEIHDVETQSIVQVIPPPENEQPPGERVGVVSSTGGYLVPSQEQSDKLQKTKVRLTVHSESVKSLV
ncbi:hypothetical protein EDD17DRAFT_1466369 [Pisolithus thermaeus]|nr:hypothetical protein EDD17DRAFT_1466369 [Pisolithus thermaeus]